MNENCLWSFHARSPMLKSCAHWRKLKFLILRSLGDSILMFCINSIFNIFSNALFYIFLLILIIILDQEDSNIIAFFPTGSQKVSPNSLGLPQCHVPRWAMSWCTGIWGRLENAMAPHSSTLSWKIPWTEEPGRLQSMGSWRVGDDWVTSLSLFSFMHWRRKWQPTPVFLPGESQGRRSLVGCRLWGRTELDTTEAT